jgi:hypothetical protein
MMRPIAFAVAPAAPTLNPATVTGNGNNRTVVLNWTRNSLNATGFTVQRATDVGFTSGLVTWPLGNVTTYSDRIGNTNQTFYYRVFASNVVGGPTPYPIKTVDSGFSNLAQYPVTAPVTPPAAPTNVLATAAVQGGNNARVTLTWTDVATETGYTIQRATNSMFTTGLTTVTVGANVTTYTTGNIARNTDFYFRVWATNGAGASAMVNATPFPIHTP